MTEVLKTLLERGEYRLRYDHDCDCGCWFKAPSIDVLKGGSIKKVFHTRFLFKPNRTPLEAIGLAFDWVLEDEAKHKRAEQEAEIAKEQAQALAEFAADLNTEAAL